MSVGSAKLSKRSFAEIYKFLAFLASSPCKAADQPQLPQNRHDCFKLIVSISVELPYNFERRKYTWNMQLLVCFMEIQGISGRTRGSVGKLQGLRLEPADLPTAPRSGEIRLHA